MKLVKRSLDKWIGVGRKLYTKIPYKFISTESVSFYHKNYNSFKILYNFSATEIYLIRIEISNCERNIVAKL